MIMYQKVRCCYIWPSGAGLVGGDIYRYDVGRALELNIACLLTVRNWSMFNQLWARKFIEVSYKILGIVGYVWLLFNIMYTL